MSALVHRKGNLGIGLSKDFGQMLGTPGIKANDGVTGVQGDTPSGFRPPEWALDNGWRWDPRARIR